MILTKEVTIKWSKANREYYESKGYVFTKTSDLLAVKIEDLTKGSHTKIKLQCDYCNKEIEKVFKDYYSQKEKSVIKKDCCRYCQKTKNKEALIASYGVDNVMKLKEVKESLKQSLQDKYGVDNYSQTEKYKEQIKQTCLEKYGVESYLMTEEFKNKSKETCLKRYGVEHVFHNEEFLKNRMESMKNGGMVAVSKPQQKIHSIIGGEINHLVGRSYLDIAFPEDMIYFEYDGGGHNLGVKMGKVSQEEFDQKEKKRSFFLRDLGWREVRIITENDVEIDDNEILSFYKKSVDLIKSGTVKSINWDVENNSVQTNNKNIISFLEFLKLKNK